MRVVMPLFDFEYGGNQFQFNKDYSLDFFDADEEIPDRDRYGLSKRHLSQIQIEDWAIVANEPNDYFHQEINLLLIAFRLFAKSDAFIKWRFCKGKPEYSTVLGETFRKLVNGKKEITDEDLSKIRTGFFQILDMYNTSNRTKSTFYFIWRGFSASKHIDAYIFLTCAIESLFSGDTKEDVTKTLLKRVKAFTKGNYTGKQIGKIYKIRSDMVHGRILHTDKKDLNGRKENVDNVGRLEDLILLCIDKMLKNKLYLIYTTNQKKENFFNKLCEGHVGNSSGIKDAFQ